MGRAKKIIDQACPKRDIYRRDDDLEFHCDDGPAIELMGGTKYWFQHGEYHRDDGPAVDRTDGNRQWYKHGKLHRTDGPAVEYPGGGKRWWVDGRQFTRDEFNLYVDQATGEVFVPPGKKLRHDKK